MRPTCTPIRAAHAATIQVTKWPKLPKHSATPAYSSQTTTGAETHASRENFPGKSG